MVGEILKAIVFGVVEGVTEWLPISSTGHLIILEEWFGFKNANAAFMSMFDVVIQLGAILAVVVLYKDKLNPFKSGKTPRQVQLTWQLWAKVVIAALPAAVIGLALDDWLDAHFHNFFVVAAMLIVYGLAFIYVERQHRDKSATVTHLAALPYRTALYIGLFQVLSLIPGTSRSGATILGGILVGTSRAVATEFTFFLGIPIMFGASLVKCVKLLLKGTAISFSQWFLLLVAMGVAFLVSLYVIQKLTDYVKAHDFTFFGKYRIGLGVVLFVYGLLTWIF